MNRIILVATLSLIVLLATSCIGGVSPQQTQTPDITTPAYTQPVTTPAYSQSPTPTPTQKPATAKIVKVYGTPT